MPGFKSSIGRLKGSGRENPELGLISATFPSFTTSVMETTTTNYKLERWIAFLLGLLFFIPFLAK